MTTQTPLDSPAAEVATGCRVLGTQDTGDPVWGHISLRDPDGRGVWMKAGPKGFDEVTEADIVLIDFDGQRLSGELRVPFEYPLHSEVMRARADVNSVVHTHAPHAIALGVSGLPLQVFSNSAGPFARGVPRYERQIALIDTPELGQELAAALGEARAMLMTGHGILATGSAVATAVVTAILLERACQLQILAQAAGGVQPAFMEPGERYVHTEAEAYLMRTWDYLRRRL